MIGNCDRKPIHRRGREKSSRPLQWATLQRCIPRINRVQRYDNVICISLEIADSSEQKNKVSPIKLSCRLGGLCAACERAALAAWILSMTSIHRQRKNNRTMHQHATRPLKIPRSAWEGGRHQVVGCEHLPLPVPHVPLLILLYFLRPSGLGKIKHLANPNLSGSGLNEDRERMEDCNRTNRLKSTQFTPSIWGSKDEAHSKDQGSQGIFSCF